MRNANKWRTFSTYQQAKITKKFVQKNRKIVSPKSCFDEAILQFSQKRTNKQTNKQSQSRIKAVAIKYSLNY
jgi:hypothetical protein